MKLIFGEDAEDATKTLFDLLKGELNIIGWQEKGQVQKEIENKIMRFLKTKLEREDAKAKAKEMVDILIKNKDA
jgi:type I restriction enzyme R subunit